MSKSAGGLRLCLSRCDVDFDIDSLTAKDFAFEGDMMFILEGERGISGDTVFELGAMAALVCCLVWYRGI
jgi:hypothetical protein